MRLVQINPIVAARIKRVLQEERSTLGAALSAVDLWTELDPAKREESAAAIRLQLFNTERDIAHLEAAMREDET